MERIQVSEEDLQMQKYVISTKTLFDALTDFNDEKDCVSLDCKGYIQKETDGNNEWYDLKTETGTPCMDGEICEVLEETSDYVVLQEETERIPFRLSRREFDIAATLCAA